MSSVPFDIELAKQGHKVETGEGLPVEILKFDRKGSGYCVIALVRHEDGREELETYTEEGAYSIITPNSDMNLTMVDCRKHYTLRVYKTLNGTVVAGQPFEDEKGPYDFSAPGSVVAEFTFRV